MKPPRRRTIFSSILIVLTIGSAISAQTPSANSAVFPMFAGVVGDGVSVGFSWWAVKGASGYELLRTPDPQQKPATIATVSSTTLGYRDTHPSPEPAYYQLVAIGAGGTRTPSAWFLYFAPTVKSASADGADVLVTWSGVRSAPGGYEVWRAPTPQQRPTRVAAVASTLLSARDKQAGTGPFYYQVVAVGAGGSRAASPWFGFNVGLLGESATTQSSAEEQLLAQLVAELKKAGIDVPLADQQELTNAMTQAGAGGAQLARYIVGIITNSHAQTLAATEGDQTSSKGDPCPTCSTGSALPQIEKLILAMPTDASTSRLTNELKALLARGRSKG
jgi:hypothetical protein